jgi:hypothetical protein
MWRVGWLAMCDVRDEDPRYDEDLTVFVCGRETMDGLEYLFSSGAITID